MSKSYKLSLSTKGPRQWCCKGQMQMYTAAAWQTSSDVLTKLRQELGSRVHQVVVGRELYSAKDTNTEAHFHVFVHFKEPQTIRFAVLDAIFQDLGKYVTVKETPERALAYCCKDGDVMSWAEDLEALAERIVAARKEWHRESLNNRLFMTAIQYQESPKQMEKEFAFIEQKRRALQAETVEMWTQNLKRTPKRDRDMSPVRK